MRRFTRLLTIAATTLVVAAATASAGAAVGTIREYTGPIDVAGAQLEDIATGPNGNLWFTESGGGSAAGGGESASGGAVTPLGPTVGPTLLGNETIRSIDGTSTRITTTVKVTAAGHLAQTAHAAGLLACRTSANPTTAGTVTLVCRLSVRAKAILTQRALRIAVTTTFTPHGFPTVTVTRLIKIPRAAGSSLPVVG